MLLARTITLPEAEREAKCDAMLAVLFSALFLCELILDSAAVGFNTAQGWLCTIQYISTIHNTHCPKAIIMFLDLVIILVLRLLPSKTRFNIP